MDVPNSRGVSRKERREELNVSLKNHITMIFNIFLMTIIEVYMHIKLHSKLVRLFQIIRNNDLAIFFEGDEAEVEDFV